MKDDRWAIWLLWLLLALAVLACGFALGTMIALLAN